MWICPGDMTYTDWEFCIYRSRLPRLTGKCGREQTPPARPRFQPAACGRRHTGFLRCLAYGGCAVPKFGCEDHSATLARTVKQSLQVPLIERSSQSHVHHDDQPHSGQRMRGGSDEPGFFSSSTSRSGTMTRLSVTGLMPSYYDVTDPL